MCIFCDAINGEGNIILLDRRKLVSCFFDCFPVTKYHIVIIPNRHVLSYFDLYMDEKNHFDAMINDWSTNIQKKDSSITGFNIGWNCGWSAGQTVYHAHCHLIPRRDGDIDNPTGGVRGVIPDKRVYK
jgi:diadenosine tetraphosphate (Ap4A) HIT family hydrolase